MGVACKADHCANSYLHTLSWSLEKGKMCCYSSYEAWTLDSEGVQYGYAHVQLCWEAVNRIEC